MVLKGPTKNVWKPKTIKEYLPIYDINGSFCNTCEMERIIKIPTNPARQVTIKDVRMCKGNIAHEYMKANPITAIKK